MPTIFPLWPHILFGVLEPISLYDQPNPFLEMQEYY